MELSKYFNQMTHDGLLVLESYFVSRISSTDYIAKERERNQKDVQYFSQFVRAKSAVMTDRSMKESKMNLNPPQVLLHHTARTASVSKYCKKDSDQNVLEQGQLKSEHSLYFAQFVEAMWSCISVPLSVSTIIFAQLCKGEPQRRHQEYQKYVTNPELADFDIEVAAGLFLGCRILWPDLLNYLSTKTTLVEPPIDLRLLRKKCPAHFSHRLTIDVLQCIPELKCYFSSGRDGLAQFWAAQGVSPLLNFLTVDEFNFGLKDEDIDTLVNQRYDPHVRRGRLDRIETMHKLLNGEISMKELDGKINILPQYIQNNSMLPFSLVTSLQNPYTDLTAFPLKNELSENEYAHSLTVACRVADAPLPSGFPLPQTIYRNIQFQGYDQHSKLAGEVDNEYDVKAAALEKIYMNRMRSQSVKQHKSTKFNGIISHDELPINDIDGLFARAKTPQVGKRAFRRKVTSNTIKSDFYGDQHPIFNVKAGDQRPVVSSGQNIYKQSQKVIDEEGELVKKKIDLLTKNLGAGKGNSWASAVCFHSDNKLTISTSDRQLLIYSLTKTGFELFHRIKIDSIAVQNCIRWDRTISKIKIDNAQHYLEQEINEKLSGTQQTAVLTDIARSIQDFGQRQILLADLQSTDDLSLIHIRKRIILAKLMEQISCTEDDLPNPGQACKQIEMIVYQSSKEIGFVNYKTKKIVKFFTIQEVLYKRFQDTNEYEQQYLDTDDLSFSCIAVLGDKLVVGINDGTIVKLDNLSMRVESSDDELHVFKTQVTNIDWSSENQMMVASSVSGQIAVYNYQSKADKLATMQDSGSILKVFVSDSYECILSVCANGVLSVWSSKSFTQLHKVFIDDNLTCACWDEFNSLLIVGHVNFQVFKVLGVKNDKKRKEQSITQKVEEPGAQKAKAEDPQVFPQAHYAKIIGVLNMDEIKIINRQMEAQQELNRSLLQLDEVTVCKEQSEEEIEKEQLTKEKLKYQQEPYKRKQDETKFFVNMDIQPAVTRILSTPYSMFQPPQFMTENAESVSINYSKDETRAQFVEQICSKRFKMLDYTALQERVSITQSKLLNKRKSKQLVNNTAIIGSDVLIALDNTKKQIQQLVEQQTGFMTIDIEGNLRHWNTEGQILASYKIEIPQDEQVISACLDIHSCTIILNTNLGNSIQYKFVTSEQNHQINVSNCARAVFVLQYDGPTLINSKETQEFLEYMKHYKPKNYERIAASTQFQQTTAYACGEFILLFDQNSRRLSARFVQKLLQQNSYEALKLSNGLSNPPSMVLHGHNANVICLNAAGRKLISADESGLICFWLGQGICKGCIEVKNDYLRCVFASHLDKIWGYIVQKDGLIVQVDRQFVQRTIFRVETSGVEQFSICKFEDPATNLIRFAVSVCNRVLIADIVENAISIVGFYIPPCCHEVETMDFINFGQELCVACSGGHIYVVDTLAKIDRQVDLFTLDNNQFKQNRTDSTIFKDSLQAGRILTVSLSDKMSLEKFEIPDATIQYFNRLNMAEQDVDRRTANQRIVSLREYGKQEQKKSMQISQAVKTNNLIGAMEQEVLRSLPGMKDLQKKDSQIDDQLGFTF